MNITLSNLTKRFGSVEALASVSLDIREGEMFFLLGPSGCGKTTLLRCLAGFYEPDAGSICFDGRDVTRLPPHKRSTGMVFQNYALWPHLTVAGNVGFGLNVPGRRVPAAERRARVEEALSLVRLDGLAARRPAELSGGQQQRVALARALVIRPGCLLLDEPLSNLDAKLRADMRRELRRLVKDSGLTAVYVTHDQKEALSMADRCAVLRAGRVEQVDEPRRLYEKPANRFVAEFMGGANLLPGKVVSVADGQARVASACGEWLSESVMGAVGPCSEVTLAVRPEALRLSRTSPGNRPNVFPAHLVDRVFLGETEEAWVRLQDGFLLKAVGLGLSSDSSVSDAPVFVEAAPADVVVLTG